MNDRPHLLHLDITKWGDLNLRLECPWPADSTELTPGRPCHILTEPDPLTGRRRVSEAGCVVEQWIDHADIEDVLHLGEATDPVFPLPVEIRSDGDGGPELHPWTDDDPEADVPETVPCSGGGLPGVATTIATMACAICGQEMLRIPDAFSDGTVPEHDRTRTYHDLLDYDADWSDS